jgi:hypothetical protein
VNKAVTEVKIVVIKLFKLGGATNKLAKTTATAITIAPAYSTIPCPRKAFFCLPHTIATLITFGRSGVVQGRTERTTQGVYTIKGYMPSIVFIETNV